MSKKGIGVVGTVRQNRLSKLSLPSKQQAQKMKRGQNDQVYVSGDQVVAVWKDSAPVYVASNFADVSPMRKCKRYSLDEKKVEVDVPNIIKVYNTNMGGVDLVDNMAWGLYRKVGVVIGMKKHSKMPLLDLIRLCVEMTVIIHGETNTSRINILPTLSTSTLSDVRKDNGNHLVIKTPDRKNVCNRCKKRTLYRGTNTSLGQHSQHHSASLHLIPDITFMRPKGEYQTEPDAKVLVNSGGLCVHVTQTEWPVWRGQPKDYLDFSGFTFKPMEEQHLCRRLRAGCTRDCRFLLGNTKASSSA
ncbi:hypothetical protein Pcinc_012353 [Petrolisthes cinctipes]|uniref:PiggyBac transposable element-derived protein domain-containing protein n=1 Tax=Petrolisthes cinctipes TaxID=88211 RepID=A0AAE1FZ30_PETCI|nr:hypothetical protein Pcinc_012353 [Petrolisthes cinctipes]